MNVRIWGGPKDGQILHIPNDRKEWTVAEPLPVNLTLEPDPNPEPAMNTTTYRITRSPYGLVAVHPSVNLKPLSQE